MRKVVLALFVVGIAIASFLAGRHRSHNLEVPEPTHERRVLYYVDPMHPTYRSDRPGTAPDCGMDLEPVYSDATPAQIPPGAVHVSIDKQRLLGLRVELVERTSAATSVRTTGRIAIDENRLFRVLAGTDGWVRNLGQNAAGTSVAKDEVLAAFYSNDFLRTQQSYFFALKTLDRVRSGGGRDSEDQVRQAEEQVRTSEEALRSLGMGDPQLRELMKTREATRDIEIASPVTGLVLARNLTPGQRLERGQELYRIANLEKVWILADVFPEQGPIPIPGTAVNVTVRELGKTLKAKVSSAEPLFDAASRTLKVRLEADNAGAMLRPDMLVDVEFRAKDAKGILISADAVIDSGLRKIVYVESEEGVFAPREVELGPAVNDRVVVKDGLNSGDRIVTAGNFLIDSESRMRMNAVQSGVPQPERALAANDRKQKNTVQAR